MRAFSPQTEATEQAMLAEPTTSGRAGLPGREADWMLHLQRTAGNRATQRVLETATQRMARAQAKLMVGPAGDASEQEADEVSERVMRMPGPRVRRACACGAQCAGCGKGRPGREPGALRAQRAPAGEVGQAAAPAIVHEVLAAPGRPLDAATRAFMEPRFGRDFGQVRLHTDERAAESAQAVNALAYTVGSDIVFGRGQYAPGTWTGKRLLAHELSHVEQQRENNLLQTVQRACKFREVTGNAILSDKEEDYKEAVRAGKYCKDTGATGVFHAGRCYREVPPIGGFPPGDQVCFDEETGRCSEDSPDVVSAVEGRNADGSCNLNFTRSIGHFAEDIFPSESSIVGAGFGLLAGAAVGYSSRLGGLRSLGAGTGALLGVGLGAAVGAGIRPLAGWLGRRGYVPTLGASPGFVNPFPDLVEGSTWQARLYVGAAKRDRALLNVFYPELKLGVTLVGEAAHEGAAGESIGPSTLTSLIAGIRVDPGQPGGHYLSFFGGPALSVSSVGAGFGAEAGIAFGRRWRWFGVSAHATYVHDPAREPDRERSVAFGFGVEVGPDKPGQPETKETAGPDAAQEVAEGIRGALEERVSREALLPPQVRARLAGARRSADLAGPDEEAGLVKARDALEKEAEEFDAHEVAFELAARMEKARRSRSPFVKLELWQYGAAGVRGGGVREPVVAEIRRIALILRDYLPERAAGVDTLLIVFRHEEAAVREEIRLPGWVAPEKGPFD